MPTISKIRFTNVIYENGSKRYNDSTFQFDGLNGALLLENGGGKTVFIQTAIQAVIPHIDLAERKMKDTLSMENGPAHIAIEWILNDSPRRYALTAVTLFMENNQLESLKYTYEYPGEDDQSIDDLPFVTLNADGNKRPSSRGEINDYYSKMCRQSLNARMFRGIGEYGDYLEENFKIIPSEWRKIATINSGEGNVEDFFGKCKTTGQLLNQLLIPSIEEAISGNAGMNFIETFEKQREHFKLNQRLLERIEQFQKVKERMDDYVLDFHAFHNSVQELNNRKAEIKALYLEIEKLLQKEREVGTTLEVAKYQLAQDQKTYDRKNKSYLVQVKQEKIQALAKQIHTLETQEASLQSTYDEKATRKQNIDWTLLLQEIQGLEASLEKYNKELALLDEQSEVQDLKAELLALDTSIWQVLVSSLASIEEAINVQELSEESSIIEQKNLQNKCRLEKAKVQELSQAISRYEGEANIYKEQLLALQDGTDIPKVVDIKQEISKLKALQVTTTQQQVSTVERLNENKSRLAFIDKESGLAQTDLKETSQLYYLAVSEAERNESEIQAIYELLEHENIRTTTKDSLYTKEETIKALLGEKIAILQAKKELAFLNESLSHHQNLAYEQMPYFTPDVHVTRWLADIADQVNYIALGTAHIQVVQETLKLSAKELYARYPYWPVTIVTTAPDFGKVSGYLEKFRSQLQTPLMLMTTESLQEAVIAGNPSSEQVLNFFPTTWENNLDASSFQQFKKLSLEEGVRYKETREMAEREWASLKQVSDLVEVFFKRYPYAAYTAAIQSLNQLKGQMSAIEASLQAFSQEKTQKVAFTEKLEDEIKALEAQVKSFQKQVHGLEQWLILEENWSSRRLKIEQHEQVIFERRFDIEQLELAQEELEKTRLNTSRQLQAYQLKREQLRTSEIYQETKYIEKYITETTDTNMNANKNETALQSLTIDVLKQQRQHLQARLQGFSHSRTSLIQLRDQDQANLGKRYKDQSSRMKDARYPLALIAVFTEEEQDDISTQLQPLSAKLAGLRSERQILAQQRSGEEALKRNLELEIKENFGQLYLHEGTLEAFLKMLTTEKEQLILKGRHLDSNLAHHETSLRLLQEFLAALEKNNYQYDFLNQDIHAAYLEINEGDELKAALQDATTKERYVDNKLAQLKQETMKFEQNKHRMDHHKTQFMEFCRKEVADIKLRETAMNGINNNTTYKDLVAYQERMQETITKNIQLAQDDRRESDVELQIFLNHLQVYLFNVLGELDLIAKKTSIKINEVKKQIFTFNIPTIDELHAKELLRSFVDRLVNELEDKQARGDYDDVKMRQDLEAKLNVKHLIQVVLEEQRIAIKCRKVTNDLKINKAPMTWESSNKWSGGEKWSKNMTLFLGLLNYLSEKKQYLDPRQKQQRVVILDNPFGKASSKHVLEPVFYIAENLGFQIIALTAHAEGSFISDYFPVVYSCRLRISKDPTRQIMASERAINFAYLEAKSPKSIARMQETEQISFFL